MCLLLHDKFIFIGVLHKGDDGLEASFMFPCSAQSSDNTPAAHEIVNLAGKIEFRTASFYFFFSISQFMPEQRAGEKRSQGS